ncbi:MAG: hydantoinase/oxoprolinase family protein [Rhodospirillales bacterium]
MAILLGFDTGGTYTDAVLYDEDIGVIASAKSITTKSRLVTGLGKALSSLPADKVSEAALVSVSTTLATNALVEAHAYPAALILVGQDERALSRAGLGQLVADGPVAFVPGGHKSSGAEVAALDEDAAIKAIERFAPEVDAFAVASEFSVRNPEHENRVRDLIREKTGLPVTCSHELTSNLDAPRRALTTLINARLIPMLQHLIVSVQSLMESYRITAPLMVVRGDGSLISAESALKRPVETILSGPAASVIGAAYLSGVKDGVVSDIGGTTTDIVMFEDGRPEVNRDGAIVGGWRTMVEAVNVRTYGLGGDSEVGLDIDHNLTLGPRRVVPISLLAYEQPDVLAMLEEQMARPVPASQDGRFAVLLRDPGGRAETGDRRRSRTVDVILDKLREGPVPMTHISSIGLGEKVLDKLVNEGKAVVAGLTPSDASHILGRQSTWSERAARIGSELYVRRYLDSGIRLARDADELARIIFERTIVESAKTIAEAVLAERYGLEPDRRSRFARHLLEAATNLRPPESGHEGIIVDLTLDTALIGIGAPAETYYAGDRGTAARLNAELHIPPNADVANAVGSVVGSVKGQASALITEPDAGRYRVHSDDGVEDFDGLEKAASHAENLVRTLARQRAIEQGAADIDLSVERHDNIFKAPAGGTVFIESRIVAIAAGRPDLDRKAVGANG